MVYEATEWQDGVEGGTPINAQALQKIENGLHGVSEQVEGRLSDASLNSTFATRNSWPRNPAAYTSPLTPRRPPAHEESWITTFAGTSGWTASAGGVITFAENQNPNFSGIAATYAGNPSTNLQIESPSNLALDLSARALVIYLEARDDFNPTIQLFLGTDNAFAQSNLYTIGPSDYSREQGLVALKVNLKAPAAGGTATLSNINRIRLRLDRSSAIGDTLVRVHGISHIPAPAFGTFILAFDDTPDGLNQLAFPVLRDAGFPAMMYAIAEKCEQPGEQLNVKRLHELEDEYGWEIGGHAYRFADHIDLRTLSPTALDSALYRMKKWLSDNSFRGNHFAYPFGNNDANVRVATERYFSTGRSVAGINSDYQRVGAPTHRIYNLRSPSFDTASYGKAAVLTEVTRTSTLGLTSILLFHTVVASGATAGGAINVADLEEIVTAIELTGARVTTLSALIGQ